MSEFSLEALSEKIYNHKTKDYFNEIINSYNNKSFRSATVMLWSVTVADLVFKLNDLVDLHQDEIAESILSRISQTQSENKKSSKWEKELVDDIFKQTALLSSSNKSDLDYLYAQRNLSAHPVLDSNLELHRPNRETVRSLIVNAVNGILSKAPFFSKKIIVNLVKDLEEAKAYLENNADTLKHYLESRFLSKMTQEVQLLVFRELWKFVFKLEDQNAQKNRNINFQTLDYLYRKNSSSSLEMIAEEPDYFSNISKNEKTLSNLVKLLSHRSEIYKELNNSAKVLVDELVDKGKEGFYYSNFKHKSLDDFHNDLLSYLTEEDGGIKSSDISHLFTLCESPEWQLKVRILANSYYGKSPSYAGAESRYEEFILPNLESYNKCEMLHLLGEINSNDQIYGRSYNKYINIRVKEVADKLLGADYDYSKFTKFLDAAK